MLIRRVVLKDYKSIARCDVRPSELTFLVGANGSGKSNFLDSLRFLSESLRSTLDHALRDRGGINEVRRRSKGHPTHFGIRVEFELDNAEGYFAFIVGAKKRGEYQVQREECKVQVDGSVRYYRVESGRVVNCSLSASPAALPDRLYLVNLSGTSEFRPVYDALSGMGFYNLNPDRIRDLQAPDPGDLLARDGGNIASVLSNLASRSPDQKQRIEEYLSKVVGGIEGVDTKAVGPKETLEFRQDVRGSIHPWRFYASSMSDGTLRALGVLVALFQFPTAQSGKRRLVGIEEPEVALHPAAAGVLTDSLRDASRHSQVIVTSHSPDLLDRNDIPDSSVVAVVAEHGETKIGVLDSASRSALKDDLYTAGELLRMDQLRPDPQIWETNPNQFDLFGGRPEQ